MKQIIKLVLIAGMALVSCLSAKAQYKDSETGRMFYAGKGDLAINGNKLADSEVFNLIGEKTYYETYLPAQKMRRAGLPIGIVGAGIVGATVAWYVITIDSPQIPEKTVVVSSAIAWSIGLIAAGTGFTLHIIGNSRLKKIAEDYNRLNGLAWDLQFGPARNGIGLTYSF